MTMQRFDILVEGHYPSDQDRDYCDDGDFVDADVARALYEALDELLDEASKACHTMDEFQRAYPKQIAALAKARGENHD